MKRLKSTKGMLHANTQTTMSLLRRVDTQITQDYHKLNAIKGAILRTKNVKTFERIKQRLTDMSNEMEHTKPYKSDKEYLLNKVSVYKRQNSHLRYAAINQAVINICSIYEDFTRRIILKYYEENVRRIPSDKETLKNKVIIDALLRNDSIHRTLAEKATDDLMYGNIDKWYKVLVAQLGMSNLTLDDKLKEVFLIRNCLVHNNRKVSSFLHNHDETKYKLRDTIKITIDDVQDFRDVIIQAANEIISEYNRKFPKNTGTWIDRNYDEN